MQLIRRYRVPALFCALAVLACELVSRPYTSMGICDDGPYILIARHLAMTGHIAYNGPTTPMLGWQLYLGAAFIKLFGFSFTTVRMGVLLVSVAMAFLLQRTLVRSGINERNATIGTLALVLSPLYLMLSVTFMTDITGLFAIVLCLYGCLRSLQASTSRATIAWLCFAVAANALCGTSRQIAWLGILVMLPSTLWLLRTRRRVLLAGSAATLAGALFIFACMQWFKHQPYSIQEHLVPSIFPVAHTLQVFAHACFDLPFLLLPIIALFLPELRKRRARSIGIVAGASLVYILLAIHWRISHPALLEPGTIGPGHWIGTHGIFEGTFLQGTPPVFFGITARVLMTIASLGGVLGLISLLRRPHQVPSARHFPPGLTLKQLTTLLAPFCIVYITILIPRATDWLFDRYALPLLVIALILLVRYYTERIQPQLPAADILLIAIMAICGTAMTHNTFALYRARVALAAELNANGVPSTSVDNGWEYNLDVELQHANYINDSRIVVPAHAYVPTPPPSTDSCQMFWYDDTPHIHPIYGVSFTPTACDGPAPFAPVHYSRWPYRTPGTLYVVRYTRPSKP